MLLLQTLITSRIVRLLGTLLVFVFITKIATCRFNWDWIYATRHNSSNWGGKFFVFVCQVKTSLIPCARIVMENISFVLRSFRLHLFHLNFSGEDF